MAVTLAACVGACRHALRDCIRIVSVINDAYSFSSRVYRRQLDSVICYATRHGYGYDEVDPWAYEECKKYKVFFFAKHCAVRQYLRQSIRKDSFVLVLDGDVAAANAHVRLELFFNETDDFIFYERIWNAEIVSGNYIVRNSVFSHALLQEWAEYETRQPLGFSSADNGALHVVLSRVISPHSQCEQGYRALNNSVSDLTPYFDWIECCRKQGLSAKRHVHLQWKSLHGNITILKKAQGFVADGAYLGWKTDQPHGYPPLYHGLKNKEALIKRDGCWLVHVE